MNRLLVRRTRVAAVSPEAAAIMQAWMPRGSRPVRYIANGISLAPYRNLPPRPLARTQLGLPADAFIIGIVARVSRQKGHLLLLDVFARLLESVPRALLLVVGDGVALPEVRARIHELQLANSVLLLGARADVPQLLAALDVFCLPSEMEGLPMTLLEAMAAARPAVTSDVGGIPQVVEDGRTGLMVPPRAPAKLEAALLSLAHNPAWAREMGEAGKQKVLREFSLERALHAYEELYRDAGLLQSAGPLSIHGGSYERI